MKHFSVQVFSPVWKPVKGFLWRKKRKGKILYVPVGRVISSIQEPVTHDLKHDFSSSCYRDPFVEKKKNTLILSIVTYQFSSWCVPCISKPVITFILHLLSLLFFGFGFFFFLSFCWVILEIETDILNYEFRLELYLIYPYTNKSRRELLKKWKSMLMNPPNYAFCWV